MTMTIEQVKETLQAVLNTLDQMIGNNQLRFSGLESFQQMNGVVRVLNNMILYMQVNPENETEEQNKEDKVE